jgi:hypothetical protein
MQKFTKKSVTKSRTWHSSSSCSCSIILFGWQELIEQVCAHHMCDKTTILLSFASMQHAHTEIFRKKATNSHTVAVLDAASYYFCLVDMNRWWMQLEINNKNISGGKQQEYFCIIYGWKGYQKTHCSTTTVACLQIGVLILLVSQQSTYLQVYIHTTWLNKSISITVIYLWYIYCCHINLQSGFVLNTASTTVCAMQPTLKYITTQ